ncbi:MAG: putative cupin superfamily sugar epimerase [Polyangiales bacterium]|jgi:predicted cupin superfamily sugar epimerase
MHSADEIIAHLGLKPHPEGGHYKETFRSVGPDPSPDSSEGRAACTTIHYLLKRGESSHWHRVDADEVWCFHAGDPLELRISDGTHIVSHTLSSDALLHTPQVVVPAGQWQAAKPIGEFTLVSCVVAPGFEFSGFEMAPPCWEPGPT